MIDAALTAEYGDQIKPLLALAKRAYGSRDTVSPQHDASREYTRLLVEYYAEGGSLLDMAEYLDVTYAGLRRRVTTASLPASRGRARKKFSDEEYDMAVRFCIFLREKGQTEAYHKALKGYYDLGYSLSKIAKGMGLSSANPLYYAVNKLRLLDE